MTIIMTNLPEEKFNQQVWIVLQNIKEAWLATVSGRPVKYRVPNIIAKGAVPKHRIIEIIYKLEEWGTLRVQRNEQGTRIGKSDLFYLVINQPKFNEVYEKYKKSCDLNSYLDDYQQGLYKGEKNLPEFSELGAGVKTELKGISVLSPPKTNFTDSASRKGYEKKWDVLQAIWDAYEAHSRPECVLVPVARLTIKGRDTQLIDGIIEGLRAAGLFQKWDRKDRWYNLESINHETLPKVYQEVGNTYKKFASTYQQRKDEKSAQPVLDSAQITVRSLKDKAILYDDKAACLRIDSTPCQLPPYKNEHYLCRVMFKKKANQPVDWSVVYEKMSGDYEKHYSKNYGKREHWRTVYDTMRRVNNRVKRELDTTDELFSWQELTIKRNF